MQKYNQPLIDDENKKIAYSNEQLADMLSVYRKLVDNHVTPSISELYSYGTSTPHQTKRPWLEGDWGGAFAVNTLSSDYAYYLPENAELAVGPYIHHEGATESGFVTRPAGMIAISKNTQHPEEAALFVDFMFNREPGISILGATREYR